MLTRKIFSINHEQEFHRLALKIFEYQYSRNRVYREFCDLLQRPAGKVSALEEIPFLPIDFFKSRKVSTTETPAEWVFTSSGTTSATTSSHYVQDLGLYTESFTRAFTHFYGDARELTILALLPSYLEREGSSLIFMADHLIKKSGYLESGFYLDDLKGLHQTLRSLEKEGRSTLLLGVSFALMDLAEQFPIDLSHTIIMETGGMKGRRKEMIRAELHQFLRERFKVSQIHSEYGMTELLSQAYSNGKGIFRTPPWMRMLIRDPEDALSPMPEGKTGGINVIDLANLHSCSFIATQDLGRSSGKGEIEILGRFDNSDIRGCNLLVL